MYCFSERFREIRKEKDITLEDISVKTGITRSTLSKYERGIVDPSLQNAKKIAYALNTTLDYLSGASDIRKEANYIYQRIIESGISEEKMEKMIDLLKQG